MLHFTEHGLLTPVEGIFITLEEIRDVFVRPFDGSETREWLLGNWMNYNRMLRQEPGERFLQWVDGSFVTQKLNPKDVDIVSFIPSHLFRKFEKCLDYYWTDNWEREGVDAYLVQVYPETWPEYKSTTLLRQGWLERYTTTKRNNYWKGFLMIEIV